MAVLLKQVSINEKDILNNLLEKYTYEFSQYDKSIFDEKGLFHYPYLDNYFYEESRFAYFIMYRDKLVGFALINNYSETKKEIDFAIAEFFIAYPYRGMGIADKAINEIFKIHKGAWQIKYHPKNIISSKFWQKVAKKYSNDNFEELKATNLYDDGSLGVVLFFRV